MGASHYDSDLSVNDALALLLGLDLDHVRRGEFQWLLDAIETDLSFAAEAVERASESGDADKIQQATERADKIEKLYWDAIELHTKLIAKIAICRQKLPTHIIITREGSPPATDYSDVYILRQSLYDWAKDEFGIDISEWGSAARQSVLDKQVITQTDYSEGQNLFLSMACLLDQLLTAKNGDWRSSLADITDKTRHGFIAVGKLKKSTLTIAVIREFPETLKDKDPTKTTRGHIDSLLEYLLIAPDVAPQLSLRQQSAGRRTLFALARATWKAKRSSTAPVTNDGDYPPDIISVLTQDIPSSLSVTSEVLTKQLQAAKLEVHRLMQKAGR